MNTKRFSEVKGAVIAALRSGRYQFEPRAGNVNEKNLLQAGSVTPNWVADTLSNCTSREATRSEHHILPDVDVWEFRPTIGSGPSTVVWYVKFYFDRLSQAWFISVHASERET